jgi:tRNA pseudouridine38-40 synthase
MRNICIVAEYDGTNLKGFQKQPDPNIRTVQGEIDKALQLILGHEVKTIGSGRTDAGVSSEEQYINFFTDSKINAENFKLALNTKLIPEISIKKSFEVPESFHARYSALSRKYRFRILNSKVRSALRRNTTFHYSLELDYELMEKAWLSLRGKHNFSPFCKSDTNRTNMFCTILDTSCYKQDDELVFFITSDSFLRGMVRLLIGTLINIGLKKILPEDLISILDNQEKHKVGFSAGATGLSLIKIEYPEEIMNYE